MRNRYLEVFAILSILTFTVGCGNKNTMNGDIGDSDSTQIDISGVYVNLNKTDPVRSYSFSPDPDNNFSGSYESTWDFNGFITNGGTQNYSGGWAVADGNLVLVDSSIVGMNEIAHSLTGEDTDEYNGTVWYIYQDYIINSEGKIEPSVGSSNTFIRDASWGYYSYSFKDDGTVQRTSKKLPSENGTYSREENIVTCSFPDSQETITLLVYDGILYCGDSVFQKDRTSIAKEIAQRQFENELTGYSASNNFQSNDATFQDEAQLKITGMTLHHEGSYLIAEGSVKNTGAKTRTFIKVKCSFKDASENVIDTDDTYACGSEGLGPNESTKFKVYIDYDQRIQSVSAYIYDFS